MVNIQKNQCAYGPAVCATTNGVTTCIRVPIDCTVPAPVPVGGPFVGALIVLAVILIGCWALRSKQ